MKTFRVFRRGTTREGSEALHAVWHELRAAPGRRKLYPEEVGAAVRSRRLRGRRGHQIRGGRGARPRRRDSRPARVQRQLTAHPRQRVHRWWAVTDLTLGPTTVPDEPYGSGEPLCDVCGRRSSRSGTAGRARTARRVTGGTVPASTLSAKRRNHEQLLGGCAFASLSLICVVAFGYYAATQGLPALALCASRGSRRGWGGSSSAALDAAASPTVQLQRRVNGYTLTSVNVRRGHVG